MRILFAAATALAMTGSAFAYQSYTTAQTTTTAEVPVPVVAFDPNVVIVPHPSWTAEQRALFEAQMRYHPGWTPEQIAAFDAMMAIPPARWTPEQRALYEMHLSHFPPDWTPAQRAMFEEQIAFMRTPWVVTTQTATYVEPVPVMAPTTLAMAPASAPVVQPSNANPERDARGIAVISDVAYVPPGYNGIPGGAMGGPVEGDDESYPPCTRERTDNCLQTYEVGD